MGEVKYFQKSGVEFEEDDFGVFKDKKTGQSKTVKRFTWRNSSRIAVQVISYGATITSIKVPDKNGTVEDVVLGFDNMEGYLSSLNPYFGATIGRVANRIGFSKFTIGDVTYNVSPNLGGVHQLHGGFKGFDKVMWNHYVEGTKLILSYHSTDGEEGFPGDLVINVTFELTETNELLIDFKATTTKPTYVNLTNHSYFNLAGHSKGAAELYNHVVSINADNITEADKDSITNGKLIPVKGTVFDLRIPKTLGDVIEVVPGPGHGFDHNFCVNLPTKGGNTFVARVVHQGTGRALEVYSNQPGVQFYNSNFIPENPETYKGDKGKLETLKGKSGVTYYRNQAFCLETQNYPNAINIKNFPKAVLNPGENYHHTVSYKFFIDN